MKENRSYLVTIPYSTSERNLYGMHTGARSDETKRAQHVQGLIKITLENGLSVGVKTTDEF